LGQAEPSLGAGANSSILTISTNNTRVWSNSLTLSTVTATGNISADYFLGNGSQLTGIITSVSNVVNGGSNLDIASANANVTISVSTVGNIAVFSINGVSVLGTITSSANILGGNLLTGGRLSATGNITGGNILTPGSISATANITGGNLLTAGLISAASTISSSANIDGGNVLTIGLVSATGNVTGGNIITNGLVTATGNITGNYFIGNGSQLTGIAAASVYANALIGNTLSANVLYSSLESVGILANISVSGNANIANISIVDTTFASNGNLILFAGSAGIGIPAGNTAQRPSSPAIGVTRFNTIISSIETWDGASWVTGANVISPGTIIDQQITPDGVSDSYLLVESSTAAGILVAINGVNQVPNLSYTVTGNSITFSQIPMSSDIIDIRFITYLTSISSLSNSYGNSSINITPSGNIQFTTANSLFATMTSNSFNLLNPVSTTGNITAPNFIGNLIGNISGNITIPGSNTQVLYNLNGNIGAGTGFTFDSAANALLVTGNITGGNLVTPGVVSATGSITSAANITGGNLATDGLISATGNIIAGNIITTGIISAAGNVTYGNIFTGGLISITGNATVGNITTAGLVSATGNATVGNITTAGLITATGNVAAGNIVSAATITAVGNITGNYFIGNGSQLTGITTTYGNANVANYLPTFSGNLTADNISVTGNISGVQFIGAGNTLSNIQGGNVSGTVSRATIADTAYAVSGANVSGTVANATYAASSGFSGTVTENAQSNITSLGTLTSLSVTGNTRSGNLLTSGLISATGAVTGSSHLGAVVSASGNIIGGNLVTAGLVSATGSITAAANITGGNLLTSGLISATSTITSTANIIGGNIATAGSLTATGNISGGNLLTAGIVSSTGNITAPYFVGNLIGNISGNLTVPGANTQVIYNNNGQANASAGLTFDFASNSLVSTGTVTGSNLLTGGYASAAGNVIGSYIIGNGATLSSITGANVSGNVANATYAVSAGSAVGTSATVTANAQPNITSVGTLSSLAVTANVTGGNILTAGQISSTGNITTAGYFVGTLFGNVTGNITIPGLNTQVIYNNNGNAGASAGFTFDSAANALVVTGNITGGRIIGNGALLSSITGSNVSGTVANATYAVSSGTTATITANAQPNITSVGTLTSLAVTANVTGGNILTAGIVSATGNITAPYFIGNLIGNISGNLTVPGANTQVIYNNDGQANASAGFTFNSVANAIVVTGNVTGGNILTAGRVSATGNITGNFFNGNGSLLTGIIADSATTAATVTTNAQPNITSVGTLTSLAVTANVTGGNILTAGLISATGNITAPYFIGNLTGNISGNITVPGANTQVIYNNAGQANASAGFTFNSAANAMVVTGNVTGGNILTAGLISSTGTVTGSSFSGAGTGLTGTASSLTVGAATSATTAGTVSTAAQPNITSVGILTSLSVSGTTQTGNLLTGGLVSATGNVTGNFFNGNGSALTGVVATSVGTLSNLSVTGNITAGGFVSATGNITSAAQITVSTATGRVNIATDGGGAVNIGRIDGVASTPYIDFNSSATVVDYDARIQVTGNTGIAGGATLAVTAATLAASAAFSAAGNITGGNLSVGTGTITVGNIVNSNANAVGNIGSSSNYFNTIFANATSAQYADLAELYLADAEYTPGTVLSFGGEEELTISTQDNDPLIAGIISTNPAYQMNSGLTGKFVVALALVGRVPCLVQGPVTAGAMMVSAGNGRARAETNPKMGTVIGKAITGFAGNLGVIEILVGRL